jgi:glycosyltransferase involved in cell wall biosynthesis
MSERRALHVLMTADAIGGVWQYALTLARELTGQGHQVTIAVLGPEPDDEQRAQAGRIRGLHLRETGLPLDWLADGPAPVERAANELAQLASRIGVDLVHCNNPALLGAARFGPPLIAVAHGCVATWWQAAKNEPLEPSFEWHAQMMRAGLVSADAVIAPSASFARVLQRTYKLPFTPLAVHNGRAPASGNREGRQLNVALTAGRLWDPVKNARVLDRAAAHLGVPLLAAGALRGPHGEEYAPAHLQALGHQTEQALAQICALRPVFVSAASFEPFGLAVLEAASAGCALVLSDIETFRELWDGAALFVDHQDARGFARAVEALIEDPGHRAALGAAAHLRSVRFTPAAMVAAMTDIYASALATHEVAA